MNDFFTSTNSKKIISDRISGLLEPLLLFSVFFLPGFISQGVQEAAPDMFESVFFNIYYLVSVVPQVLLVLYIITLKPGRELSDFDIGPLKKRDLPFSLLALAGIYICIVPVGLVSVLIEPELENQFTYGAGWQFSNYKLLPLVFLTCLVTGYTEEIFFRSYLYKSLLKAGTGVIPSVIITSLLFGSGHIYEGYFALASTAVIGAFLSFMFIKTRSIHTVAIGHGLYNFSVLLIAMTGEL